MDGIHEGENLKSKRLPLLREESMDKSTNGFSPFLEDPERLENEDFKQIISKPIFLPHLGIMKIILQKPLEQQLNQQLKDQPENDQAVTLDNLGNVKRRKRKDLLEMGYYDVEAEVVLHEGIVVDQTKKEDQNMYVNIWMENKNQVIRSRLTPHRSLKYKADFISPAENSGIEHFMLPDYEQILKPLKVNVSSQ